VAAEEVGELGEQALAGGGDVDADEIRLEDAPDDPLGEHGEAGEIDAGGAGEGALFGAAAAEIKQAAIGELAARLIELKAGEAADEAAEREGERHAGQCRPSALCRSAAGAGARIFTSASGGAFIAAARRSDPR
jgi:hypothetical protein